MPVKCSFGGAIATCGGYAAWLVGGNVADLCLKRGISWRWVVVGLSVGCGASSLAILAFLREPPVGRFIDKKEVRCMAGTVLCLQERQWSDRWDHC